MKRAFTLMEVNLAILIMAGGILAMVSLFSLGYRENRQSREDVGGAAIADTVLSPMIMAASATNLVWKDKFQKKFCYPENGWRDYFNDEGIVEDDPQDLAKATFNEFMDWIEGAAVGGKPTINFPSEAEKSNAGLSCGLVVMHDENSPIVRIALRATKQPNMLLSMPIYYTEVRFQGDTGK